MCICALLVVIGCSSSEEASGRLDAYHFRKVDPELGTQFFAIYREPDEVTVSRDNPPQVGMAALDLADLELVDGLFSAGLVAAYRGDSIAGREAEPGKAGESANCECNAPPCLCVPENGPEPQEVSYYVQLQGEGLMVFGKHYSSETARMLRENEAMYDRYHEAAFGRAFER